MEEHRSGEICYHKVIEGEIIKLYPSLFWWSNDGRLSDRGGRFTPSILPILNPKLSLEGVYRGCVGKRNGNNHDQTGLGITAHLTFIGQIYNTVCKTRWLTVFCLKGHQGIDKSWRERSEKWREGGPVKLMRAAKACNPLHYRRPMWDSRSKTRLWPKSSVQAQKKHPLSWLC